MPGTYPGLRWKDKPPAGSQLDRSHPLARGLWDCVLFNEGGGRPGDLAAPASPATFTGSPTWSSTPAGRGLYCTGGSSADLPYRGGLATGDFTLRLLFRPRTWTGGFTCLFDANSALGREMSLFVDTSGNLSFYGIGQATGTLSTPTGMAAGSAWDLVVTRAGTLATAYVNGQARGTWTSTGTGTNPAFQGPLSLGSNPSTGGTNPDVDYLLFQFWRGRALSAAAAAGLAADPYQLVFAPTTRRFLAPPAGGALSGSGSASALATASASGTLALAGSGSSAAIASASGSGVLAIAGGASAVALATASAAGSLALAGSGSASSVATASASGSLPGVGSGSAQALATASASGSLALAGSGSSAAVASASASGTLALAGSGSAGSVATASASGSIAGAGGGSAGCVSTATAAGSLAIAGSGSASSVATASATLSVPGAAAPTSFEEDLLAFLNGLGLVCYAGFVPQDRDPAAPALYFTRIWTDREKMLAGSTGLVEAHYQLTVQSRDYLDLVATSEQLRLALDGRRYFLMNGTRLVFVALMKDQTTAYEAAADRSDLDGTHQLATEFWFHYRESIPTF